MEKMINAYKISVRKLKETDHLGDLSMAGG
jgi:hypothetical protein